MDLDLITLILLIIILIYLVVSRVKMYREYKAGLEIANERKAMKKMFTGQFYNMIYIIVMILSVVGLIFVLINKANIEDSFSWLLLLAVIFFTAGIDLIRIRVEYTAHYNDHGMYINQDYIRYNSIKDYTQKNLAITTKLHTFNGKSYIVPTKTLRILKDKIEAKHNKNL